ncbi:MAG TPA: hypothetical protein VNU72_12715 [Puia sp.]|jgi:hypothetical protein|nr:hypothetical protein [Puia sp.]
MPRRFQHVLVFSLLLLFGLRLAAEPGTSTAQQALEYIKSANIPDSSSWWPNIQGHLFIENLKANILSPLAIYQGSNTNFCGYAALSYLPLHDDPLTFTRFLVFLYKDGKADWGNIHFSPSQEIHVAVGTLRFKGILDIRPADQMWFLILADHFRSYINFFTRRFHPGAENTFWAACNYGKFNRIIRDMLGYHVRARGSDLIRPSIDTLVDYLGTTVQTGVTYLYVNNTYLHKKDHDKFKGSFPTHYIVLQRIWKEGGQDDLYNIVYWDYGGRTLRQVTGRFLKKITFGITHCTKLSPPS